MIKENKLIIKSPYRLALLILSAIIVSDIFVYLILGFTNFKFLTPFILGISGFLLGSIYFKEIKEIPDKKFVRDITVIYFLISRIWVIILASFFFSRFESLIENVNIWQLIITSIVVFISNILILSYSFLFGTRYEYTKEAKNRSLFNSESSIKA